jgi:hypothetical protein
MISRLLCFSLHNICSLKQRVLDVPTRHFHQVLAKQSVKLAAPRRKTCE